MKLSNIDQSICDRQPSKAEIVRDKNLNYQENRKTNQREKATYGNFKNYHIEP